MELYQYKAVDERGRIHKGRITASNMDELALRMEHMGLDLIRFKPIRPGGLSLQRSGIRRRDLINFCFQLEQLTQAGVSLVQGLNDLREAQENRAFRDLLAVVIEHIEQGQSLSTALSAFPRVFDAVFINLVRVGERSGSLPAILHELTATLKWNDEIAARAKRVMLYPVFVALVVGAVMLFLMVVLVPQLTAFILSMDAELPAHTKLLLAVSEFLTRFWFPVLCIPLVPGVFALAARNSPDLSLRIDTLKLRIVVLGEILQKIILARFARIASLMYGAGIPVLDILELNARFAGNRAIEMAVGAAHRRVEEGESIAGAFEQARLFPPLVLRMIALGESTGALDKALLNVSYFYDRDVKERIDRVEALVEPVLTCVLGLILGWIMLAVLGPIYDLVSGIRA